MERIEVDAFTLNNSVQLLYKGKDYKRASIYLSNLLKLLEKHQDVAWVKNYDLNKLNNLYDELDQRLEHMEKER